MWKHKPPKVTVHSGEINVWRCVTEGIGTNNDASVLQAENWTLRKVYKKFLGSFEVCSWRMMEKISWIDHVRNEEVLQRVKKLRNVLQPIKEGRLIGLVTSSPAAAL
jgi:hypothetical protein